MWELGAGGRPSGKARGDFSKREEGPHGLHRDCTTFVSVTHRLWTAKARWAAGLVKGGERAEVRAYDSADLEEQLEAAPPAKPSTPRVVPAADGTSGICGVPTKLGKTCQRKVKGGGRCYQHRG